MNLPSRLKTPSSHTYDPKSVWPRGFERLPKSWQTDYCTYPSRDRAIQLYSAFHKAKKPPNKKYLVVVHGFGEHSGRYEHFAHSLNGHIAGLFLYDHRGHGKSEGQRGHVASFDDFIDDLIVTLRRLDDLVKGAEIHLFAHSMGGLVALHALKHVLPLQSCILSAPLLGLNVPTPLLKVLAARVAYKFWGELGMQAHVGTQYLSHDPEIMRCCMEDRLVHDRITPSFFFAMQKSLRAIHAEPLKLSIPLTCLLPLDDHVVDPEATHVFMRTLDAPKKLIEYAGFYHEAFHEIGRERVFADIKEHLDRY